MLTAADTGLRVPSISKFRKTPAYLAYCLKVNSYVRDQNIEPP
jgi:hypothetical protein